MAGATLRYVDPHRRRGPLVRAYVRVVNTRPGAWVSRHVVWKLDPILLRLTRSRLGFGVLIPTALLETTGARTGRPRANGVIYFHDGDQVVVVASKAGAPTNPDWFHNVVAHPDVVLGGQPFHAQVVDDEAERARTWALADQVFAPFADYRRRTAAVGRTIPLLRLTPR